MDHQDWSNIVTNFKVEQQKTLNIFTELAKTYSQGERKQIVYLIQENADEMEHHGYNSSPYHNDLLKGLQASLKLSPHTAEAFMISYQLATPNIRTRLKDDILGKESSDTSDEPLKKEVQNIFKRRILKNALNQYADKILFLGKQILYEQLPPITGLSPVDLRKNHPLYPTLFRLAQLPPAKRKQAAQFFSNSQQIVIRSGIDQGVSYLAKKLLPILIPDNASRHSRRLKTRSDKMKQTYNTLKIFGWFLLTQHTWDQESWIKTIEIKRQHQFERRQTKDFTSHYCC